MELILPCPSLADTWYLVYCFVGIVIFCCPSLEQVNAAAGIIQSNVHADANIIVGALVDERCGKQVSVTVLATGFGVSRFTFVLSKLFSPGHCYNGWGMIHYSTINTTITTMVGG